MTMDELHDRYDDEHLIHFYAVTLIEDGVKSREQLNKEMARNLGMG